MAWGITGDPSLHKQKHRYNPTRCEQEQLNNISSLYLGELCEGLKVYKYLEWMNE